LGFFRCKIGLHVTKYTDSRESVSRTRHFSETR
jgi:hypothetical protein